MTTPPRPPRGTNWLLRICLPRGVEGQTLRGDLIEEFSSRASSGDERAARRWFRRQGVGLAMHYAARRTRLLAPPFGHDLRLAGRSLAAQPALTLAIVLMVGVSLGANTALFSVFDGLLFRPLPYRDADRIVHMELLPEAMARLVGPERDQVRQQERSSPLLLERANAGPHQLFDVAGPAVQNWQLRSADLNPSAFELLGVWPILGRPFVEADSTDQKFSVLLGYDVWQTRFGGDPGIVDQLVSIPGTSSLERWRVVGVMPKGFSFPEGANFWIPVYAGTASPLVSPYARLAPGATIEQVRAALPDVTVTPLRAYVRPDGAAALGVLLSGTTLLLLLAFVQVAALLFARATGRTTEIGVRLALGASRLRLMRQFGIEALLLVCLALGVGTLAAPLLTSVVVGILPEQLTVGQHLTPDLRAYLFGSGMAAAGVVSLALLPFSLIRQSSPLGLLSVGAFPGGRPGSTPLRAARIRTALFVGQLAVAACLIYLSGLALRSYALVGQTPLGFDPDPIVAIKMPRREGPEGNPQRDSLARLNAQREMVAQTMAALQALPDVADASGAGGWPFQAGLWKENAALVAETDPEHEVVGQQEDSVFPGYFAALGVELLSGAEPDPAVLEVAASAPRRIPVVYQAVVNESLARQLERFGNPVGQRLVANMLLRYHVVGVIPDLRLTRPDEAAVPTAFVYLPPPAAPSVVLVRLTRGRALGQVGIQTVLDRIWGDRAPTAFPLADAVHSATTDYRARTLLLNLISVMAIPLTLMGVAGALTYATRQRVREIAIELALGAEPQVIERRVIRQTLRVTALALVMGLGLGVAIGKALSSSLFGISPADPMTLAAATLLITVGAWTAALRPARRAGRINPADALREA